jgi:hypothetical protein
MPLVVQARLKPLDEIPPEFLCCDAMRQRFIDTSSHVLKALLGTLFEAEIECPFCHKILDDVRYVRLRKTRGSKASCIAVACYEFDEGIQGCGDERVIPFPSRVTSEVG